MLKKTLLLSIVVAITLILLRPHGKVTGTRTIDSSILRLESTVQEYANFAMAYLTGASSDSVEATNDETTLAGRWADRQEKLITSPNSSATSSLAGGGGQSSRQSGDFVVQAGVFRDPANAEGLVRTLRESRFAARSYVLAGDLHAVTIGPFLDRSVAEEAARSVADTTGLSPIVIRSDLPPR